MDRNFLDDYFKMEREHWWFRVREGIILDQFKTSVYKGAPLQILNVVLQPAGLLKCWNPLGKYSPLNTMNLPTGFVLMY